jgi:lipopolysaccharide transport system ATP-binding protein
MSKVAIRVEGLGKQYGIGRPERYRTLRETVSETLSAPFRKIGRLVRHMSRVESENVSFWALKDVSFEVPWGTVVGVIGRNGAGKSTLLKVLSRITEPTEGRVEIHGRVGSLLEVGTGFHPELTGRENIFLNGAILGMRSREIARQFDEIVAFAEVDKFIDTPVKHYSTGMHMRLAFAVAAHLDPEILLVDEVLAVGDVQFQKKCLGKIGDVVKGGRTVLFVSHNMPAVERLCQRCVLLKRGKAVMVGDSASVVSAYLRTDIPSATKEVSLVNHPGRVAGSTSLMKHLRLSSTDDETTSTVRMGAPLVLEVSFDSPRALQPVLGVVVKGTNGAPLFGVDNRVVPIRSAPHAITRGSIRVTYSELPLMPGTYLVDLVFGDRQSDLDTILEAAAIEVLPADFYGSGKLPLISAGPFVVPASFEVESTDWQTITPTEVAVGL